MAQSNAHDPSFFFRFVDVQAVANANAVTDANVVANATALANANFAAEANTVANAHAFGNTNAYVLQMQMVYVVIHVIFFCGKCV